MYDVTIFWIPSMVTRYGTTSFRLRCKFNGYDKTSVRLRYQLTEYEKTAYKLLTLGYDTILFWLRYEVTEYDITLFPLQYNITEYDITAYIRSTVRQYTGKFDAVTLRYDPITFLSSIPLHNKLSLPKQGELRKTFIVKTSFIYMTIKIHVIF